MVDDTLIWPSKLHHLCLTTGQRPEMISWYRDTMGLTPEDTDDGMTWMRGNQRNLLLQDGKRGETAFVGLAVSNTDHLERLRTHLEKKSVSAEPLTSPLFRDNSFAITDPTDTGSSLSEKLCVLSTPDGCLQHVVFATTDGSNCCILHSLLRLISDIV